MGEAHVKSRILVTGGAGFIGSNLVRSLLEQDHEVTALDNYWTGVPSSLNQYLANPSFRFIRADVVDSIPEDARAEQIYHLACPASPVHFTKEPLRILDTCYHGTKNVLEAAKRWNARILLASTSEIYGQAERNPQDESYFGNVNSFGPRACYDEGKRIAETLVYGYRQQFATDVRVARIFNSYGPGMHGHDGRVVCSFIAAAIQGKEMTIYGDGASTRCFQFVDDCVAGLQSLMDSDWKKGPVNIGSEEETTVVELAKLVSHTVASITGQRESGITYLQSLPDDPVQRRPDCSLAREVLGWRPQVSLSDGLRQTIEWHLSQETRQDES